MGETAWTPVLARTLFFVRFARDVQIFEQRAGPSKASNAQKVDQEGGSIVYASF